MLLPLIAPTGARMLEQNVPLAIAIVVGSSFLYASGSTLQHLAVGTTVDAEAENRTMSLRQFWTLVRKPRWLLGLTLIFIGASAHIVGLMLAPVTVVQPVGILAVPWAVMMAARIHRHRVSRQMVASIAATIGGIVLFTLMSASSAAPHTVIELGPILVGCLITMAIGTTLGYLGARGPARWRCLMWASGGSFFYGLSAAMVKTTFEIVNRGGAGSALFWAVVPFLVASYAVGGFMVQQGLANGPAEVTVGSMTTTDPIVGVTFGLLILGEGAHVTGWHGLGMAIGAVLAIGGVVLLSRYHPDSQRDRPAGVVAQPLTTSADI